MQSQKELLSEFSIPTYEEWRKAAEDALKGAPFEKKLITKTYENIDLQPIYNKSDRDKVAYLADSMPGSFPFSRGTSPIGYKSQAWKISQAYSYPVPIMLNKALKDDLENGQTGIAISVCGCRSMYDKSDCGCAYEYDDMVCQGVQINDIKDFEDLFADIDITKYAITFLPTCPAPFAYELATLFVAYCEKHNIKKSELDVNFGIDFTYYMVRWGSLPNPIEVLFDDMAALMKLSNELGGHASAVSIDGCTYHNSGANALQEIAYSMATGVLYIKEMLNRGLQINEIAKNIHFNFSAGVKFFTEIAKLRAARVVWAKIIKEFGGDECSQQLTIHTFTSKTDKTQYDPYVNVLRGTTEGLSAILAGTNSLHIGTFDEELGMASEFSRRVARNIQNVLRDEAHILDTIDPAGGSYYVETLTDKFVTEAWKLFQNVEKQGGLSTALFNGKIQDEIAAVVAKRNDSIAFRKDTVLGTNKYPNLTEAAVDSVVIVDKEVPKKHNAEAKARKKDIDAKAIWSVNWQDRTVKMLEAYKAGAIIADIWQAKPATSDITCKPVPAYRSAALFEYLRQAATTFKTKTGKAPQIYFECFGTLKQYKPRVDFSTDFFAVAGFDINLGKGFTNAQDAIANINSITAPVVVICSTDDIYAEVVPSYATELKKQKPNVKLILAGLPADLVEQFKQAGVDNFIHIKSNVYATLEAIYKSISVL